VIQGVHISSASLVIRPQAQQQPTLPVLKLNQIVEATVLNSISPTKAELLIDGNKVVADTSLLLTQGEQLKLKVVKQEGQQVLKIVVPGEKAVSSVASLISTLSKDSPFASLAKLILPSLSKSAPLSQSTSDSLPKAESQSLPGLKADSTQLSNSDRLLLSKTGSLPLSKSDPQPLLKPDPSPLGSLSDTGETVSKVVLDKNDLAHLRSLLMLISLKSGTADNGLLPRLLEQSGLGWEKNLGKLLQATPVPGNEIIDNLVSSDLKGSVLKLLTSMDPAGQETANALKEFSETIEQFQSLNRYSSESGRYLVPFPIFSDHEFSYGQLLFDLGDNQPRKGRDSKRLIRVSMLLAMTRLGTVRIDFSVFNKDISGGILVPDPDVRSLIVQHMPQLKNKLKTHGFNVLQMDCTVAGKEVLSQTSLFDAVVNDARQMVNIVI